jgi:hypothetical protein
MRLPTLTVVALLVAGFAWADVDGDGIEDGLDNCPYAANFGQEDAGGPLALPDGIGDVCQCGDVDGDGVPSVRDVTVYRRALGLLGPGLVAPEKCDVAPLAGACDSDDVVRLRQAIAGGPLGIEPICAPALPPAGVCGNGELEPPEPCDGAALGGATCESLGFLGGALACTSACELDTSGCVPFGGPGDACTGPDQCDGGLPCVDGVCCTSACGGTCARCNLPGTEGTCTAIAAGADPDAECGAVSCSSWYAGFSGDVCRRRADAAASVVSCNGAGACQSASQLCPAQPAGSIALVCDATCQDPNLSTCTGTTAGACINVNPGTQTCGVGQCTTTVNQCLNGEPITCSPGAPTSETCNDVDDNCNGVVDDGAFGDGFEPNPDCGSARTLSTAGSDQTRTYTSSMTVYPSGDWDYYRVPLTETDSSCGCGGFSFDEDYEIRVAVTAPAGIGSMEVCLNTNSCGWPAGYCFEVAAGQTLDLQQYLDGECPGQDDYVTYLRIRGLDAPGFECRPYTLSYTFDAGLCR